MKQSTAAAAAAAAVVSNETNGRERNTNTKIPSSGWQKPPSMAKASKCVRCPGERREARTRVKVVCCKGKFHDCNTSAGAENWDCNHVKRGGQADRLRDLPCMKASKHTQYRMHTSGDIKGELTNGVGETATFGALIQPNGMQL
eukprot:1152605-Pelagomonas_calceolata.AAC.7